MDYWTNVIVRAQKQPSCDPVTNVKPIDILRKWDESLHRHIALTFDDEDK